MPPSPAIDIHQHLWPPELIDALRSRRRAPKMRGWTLILDGEPPYEVDPVDHDPVHRRELDQGRIVVGPSSPLGIEDLPPEEAAPLLTAWHDGAQRLRPAFDAWASVTNRDPDVGELRSRLAGGARRIVPTTPARPTPARPDQRVNDNTTRWRPARGRGADGSGPRAPGAEASAGGSRRSS